MQDTLTNINSQLNKFMDKYKQNPKLQKEIDAMIYKHPIFKSKKNIQNFGSVIKKSGDISLEELENAKAQTQMYQKRKEEIDTIKEFVNVNYLKMLPDEKGLGKQVKALPPKKDDKDNKESNKPKKEQKPNDNNIICGPKDEEEEDKKDDDDIKVETIPIQPPNLLGKKRKNKDKKQNQNDVKKGVVFKFCYICKTNFTGDNIHPFYSNLCKICGDYNYSFRTMKLDFNGRIAVVTGGRVKIGFYIVLKLLSYGTKVIITSRFPKDTLLKFQKEKDYEQWKNNLLIYPIDFRIFESTVKFVKFLTENFPHIDILINNAAQTIRRTTSYYKYLLPIETQNLKKEDEMKIVKNDFINLKNQLEAAKSERDPTKESNSLVALAQSTEDKATLPLSVIASQIRIMEEKEQPHKTMIGNDGQTYDFSQGKSSWNMELDEVPFQEFTEVQIINTWTPYYLCVKLKPLMMKSPFPDKYIVNVSSVEGIFNHFKRTSHPHTNMAKAALNMMTRTCGAYYKNYGIYMTSVDTGWVSPMNEMNRLMDDKAKEAYEKEFCNVPLDELDGAMRVLHPIIEGIKNKKYMYGILLKDYQKSAW